MNHLLDPQKADGSMAVVGPLLPQVNACPWFVITVNTVNKSGDPSWQINTSTAEAVCCS